MSVGAMQIAALIFGAACTTLLALTGRDNYFIVANIWLAASLVIGAVNKR